MENKTQTPNKQHQYEVGTSFVFNQPAPAPNPVLEGLGRVVGNIKLETRMLVFDKLHGTQYRSIRHQLIEEQRRRQFEESIGLVATKR